jgi:hypothetical protein
MPAGRSPRCAALPILALGFAAAWPGGTVRAQDNTQLVNQLRRQLEQMQRRLEVLEAQQRAAAPPAGTAARRTPAPAPPAAPPAVPPATSPGGVPGPIVRQQPAPPPPVAGQGEAVDSGPPPSMLPSQGPQQPPDQIVTMGTMPGSIRIPGTGTSVRLYGFAVGVMSVDGGARNRSDTVTAQSIPLSPSAASRQGGEVLFSARRSRLGLETSTATSWGPLHTVVEFDFAGSQSTASLQSQATSNSYIPRLRHAYGELGPFLAGQTWSLLFDENYPQRVDYATPFATSNVRQAQFRYTHQFGHGITLAGSIEQPYTDLTTNDGVRLADVDSGTTPPLTVDKMPDFLARLHWSDPEYGSVALTGLLRPHLELTNSADFTAANRYTRSATGWGLQVAAMARVFERDRAFLRFIYGQGIGRYLDSTSNGQGSITNARLDGVGPGQVRMNEVPVVAALLGYTHYWTPTLRTNATMAWASLSYPQYAAAFTGSGASVLNKDIGQGVINLIWSPIPRVDVGVEYLGTTRTLLHALPAGSGTEGAKGGVSHRAVTSATFRF